MIEIGIYQESIDMRRQAKRRAPQTWYICIEEWGYALDDSIMNYLNIPKEEYHKLLNQNNADTSVPNESVFVRKIDTENFIKSLEPYVIMKGLTE